MPHLRRPTAPVVEWFLPEWSEPELSDAEESSDDEEQPDFGWSEQ